MKKTLLLSFILVFTHLAFAIDLTGIGYGKTEKDAKNEALADLSSLIKVKVKSKYYQIVKGNNSNQIKEIKSVVLTESDLPILGVKYNLFIASSELMAEAHLNPDNVKKLYQSELNTTYKNVKDSLKFLEQAKTDIEKYNILTDLLTYIDRYSKYKAVALLIGLKNINTLPVTESEVKARLLSLEQSVSSIDLGAKILVKELNKYNNVYIFPSTTMDSQEITPFSSILKDKMLLFIKNASSVNESDYFYRGQYIINKNSIDVTYRLIDRNGNTKFTKVVNLKKNSYKDYRIRPETVDFDRLLHQGAVLSDKFRVQVTTNKGSRDLIFRKGQNIKILIKINKSGYYYIVGHVNEKKKKYSYLIELNEGEGNRKFVQRVSADDVNKWIVIGDFEVVPPFGVENIQIMASNKDLVNFVPNGIYNESLGLYIISNNPKEAVVQTRAIRKKKSKKTYFSEAVLTFTTMK
jgi:hypothetical protein